MTRRRRRRITIQSAVKEILLADKRIHKIMNTPYFNTSAYAREIQKQVERKVGTKVKLNTITVSLKRLQRRLTKELSTGEGVGFQVSDLQVKAPVKVGVFEPDKTVLMFIGTLIGDKRSAERVFYVQVRKDEVLVVYPRDMYESFEKVRAYEKSNGDDYAMLVVKVEEDVATAVEEIASRLAEEEVECKVFAVQESDILFVIRYNELIKVLAWFS